ncbi:hypothetical protein AVEN_39088-1 [Araneus ventricosus]|uniref:Uncharacterized protein n=1 Tax=Araneus ventricosus TaxID=182803 RepID=A0A4Y2DEF3_ARAVE|nr:hypothetical protein AVEN_39088-1 [Araneus ventricosus]
MNSNHGDHFGDFDDNTKFPENARIMILSLVGAEISRTFERNPCDVTSCRKGIKYRELIESVVFGALTAVEAGKLIHIEGYWKCCY